MAIDLTSLLSQLLGGKTSTDTNSAEDSTTLGSTVNNQTTDQTSNTTQNTTGSSNTTTTGSSNTSTNADITALQNVFAKQSAGITPDMLSAIFSEGSKQVPVLQNAYANSVGARASDNTPLATSLTGLQASLTNQAAVLNNQLLADSSATAARIADLTKSSQTSNSSTVAGTQQSTSISDQILQSLLSGTTDTATDQTHDTSSNVRGTTTADPDALKILGGGALGLSGLDVLLGGNGTTGGLNDIFAAITGKGSNAGNVGNWLSRLFGGTDFSGIGGATGANPGFPSGLEDLIGAFGGWADGGPVTAAGASGNTAAARVASMKSGAGLSASERVKAATPAAAAPTPAPTTGSEIDTLPGASPMDPQLTMLLGMLSGIKGVNASTGAGSGLSPGAPNQASPEAQQMIGKVIGLIGKSMMSAVLGPVAGSMLSHLVTQAVNAGGESAPAASGPTGSVSVSGMSEVGPDGQSAVSAAAGIGDAAEGGEGPGADGGDGGGGSDGSGTAGGDGGDGGWKDGGDVGLGNRGGKVPGDRRTDPSGTHDTVTGRLSIGEVVIPTDVVDTLGNDFFEHLINRYHTPVAMQRAMGV